MKVSLRKEIYTQAFSQKRLLEGRAIVPEYIMVSQEVYDALEEDVKKWNITMEDLDPPRYLGLLILVDPTLKGAEVKIK